MLRILIFLTFIYVETVYAQKIYSYPSSLNVLVTGKANFSIYGGRPPYKLYNGSQAYGKVLTLSSNSFQYIAPTRPTKATIAIRDSLGALINVPVGVYDKLALSFYTAKVPLGWDQRVPVNGGKAPFSFTLSGSGTLIKDVYRAPSTLATGSAVVKVRDSMGQTADFSISLLARSSSAVTLSGNYIPEAYAPGCVPVKPNDFMETPSVANMRRVEPRDCALTNLTTPVFAWVYPHDVDALTPMTLRVRRLSDNATFTKQTNIPRSIFQSLSPGSYVWTVQYTTKSRVQVTSSERRFTIGSSNTFSIPKGPDFATIVSYKAHPRILPTGSSFAAIATKSRSSDLKLSFEAFLQKANTLVNAKPTAVPPDYTRSNFNSDAEFNDWLLSLRNKTRDELDAIETLGYSYHFTNNNAFAVAAINRLTSLAAWSSTGATSEARQDQANREIYLALSLGLDLFHSKLTSSQKNILISSLRNRLSQVMVKLPGLNRGVYDSHLLTATLYTTEALMYVAGLPEFPEAKDLLATAWESMITMAGTWGGYDGAYGNGTAYGWYTLTTYARLLASVRLISDINLTYWELFGKFGNNQLAFTPANARLRGQFGDEIEITSHYYDYTRDAFRVYAALTGKAEYEWYWRAYSPNVTYSQPLFPHVYFVAGTQNTTVANPPLANSFLFEDAGYVAMHSSTADSMRSSVFFRSSKLGSLNHSHADNNAFTFVSRGKDLLITGGHYPYYNSPHHAMVGRATRFKNALTFDNGIGQSEPTAHPTSPGAPVFSMEPSGKLVNFKDTGKWVISTGDATLAYRGRNPSTGQFNPLLNQAIRTVAYNRDDKIVIIYDFATSSYSRRWELNFQSLFAPRSLGTRSIQITNDSSTGCIDIHGPAGSFSFTQGFPVAPEKSRPTQHQSRFSVSSPTTQFVAVTVIREDCSAIPVNVQFSSTSATINVNGKSITANGRVVQIND